MRRLIAHVGAHKTGTTAFQRWLQVHRRTFFDAGYLVPEAPKGNHVALIRALYETERRHRIVGTRFFDEAGRNPSRDLLLSAEHIENMDADALKAMTARFDGYADERIAIFVVRDPIASINSGFGQHRKSLRGKSTTFDNYVDRVLKLGRTDWKKKIERLQAAGFAVRVLPYDGDFNTKGSSRKIIELPDFGGLADRFDWSEPMRANPSIGAYGLIIMDLFLEEIQAANPDTSFRSPLILRERVMRIERELFEALPLNGFTPAARRRVIEASRPGNDWVAAEFLGGRWDDLLPPEPEQAVTPLDVTDLSPDEARLARDAVAEIVQEAKREGWMSPRRGSADRVRDHGRDNG